MNAQAGAVVDGVELIALPVSWQILIAKTKRTGFTRKTRVLRKMADRTPRSMTSRRRMGALALLGFKSLFLGMATHPPIPRSRTVAGAASRVRMFKDGDGCVCWN